ncbi:TRDMT methyltransferase, partial [Psilopogon haemacephalus]|nr:TRDMT methyltransferase [Psilopogon haemacephalus]
ASCRWAEVVAAVDVNTLANEVYKHNFPGTPLWAKTIEGITLQEFDRLSFDMILMSPPCQPFTRTGLQGDVSDPRTKSFLYVLHVLPRLQKLPTYLLLENVKGFESSSARAELLQMLEACGFEHQEFLLSPTCLGIPNSRLRYFLLARRSQDPFPFRAPGQVSLAGRAGACLVLPFEGGRLQAVSEKSLHSDTSPECSSKSSLPKGPLLFKLETAEELARKEGQDADSSIQMLEAFLEEEDEEKSQYLLPPKSLLRYAFLLDIVKPSSRRSTCFTKGYGHYMEGTGSVLQTAVDVQLESVFKGIEELPEEEKLLKLSTLKLRYFTPREIANLHGFPLEFGFPDQVTAKQRYRLLGNSLNVHLVAKLISILLG